MMSPSSLALWAQSEGTFWLPPRGSTYAGAVDALFYFILGVSAFFFVLIVVLMIVFAVRYRRRAGHAVEPSPSHNTYLELLWSVIPAGILVAIFYHGFVNFMDMRTPPRNAYDIEVVAKQWSWEFIYPNGASSPDLHIPVNQPVRLTLRSIDVIHSLFIPAFRQKMDAVPGRYTTTWFQAIRTGEFDLYCTEYCGQKHWDMLARVYVHKPDDFERWLEKAARYWEGVPPEEAGEMVYQRRGCGQCHSLDGKPGTGPTFKGIWGETHQFTNSPPAEVDADYIRESIENPTAKVRQGFLPQMPPYVGIQKLKPEEISSVVALIRSLGKEGSGAGARQPAGGRGEEKAEKP